MEKPPASNRLSEIRSDYENRRKSRAGKDRLFGMIGELLGIIDAMAHEDVTREPFPATDGRVKGIGAFEISQRALETGRPQKPPTPSPMEWKRMSPEAQSAHFQAVQAYETSLTAAEREAILAQENEAEVAHRAKFAGWKDQFQGDAPR